MSNQQYVTRGELKEEFSIFEQRFEQKMDEKFEKLANRFETFVFDALKLERDHSNKRFDAVDARLDNLIAQNAVEHSKINGRLFMLEKTVEDMSRRMPDIR